MTDTSYSPSDAFAANALISEEKYEELYKQSIEDPVSFWAEQGKVLDWMEPYTQVKKTCFDFGRVDIKWYADGVLNVSANCIDRHLSKKSLQTAIIFEPD
ncbi:acetyl-coenzyme A synthetase N-terminal domain-containing protein, partial [Celeribacter naphthalenivorans]